MVMQKRTVRELAKGEFFRLTESDTAPVRVRGEYSRHAKKYSTQFRRREPQAAASRGTARMGGIHILTS